MLRIPKKVEYGIIAICYMANNSNELFSVKEIANNLNISSEFLSKIMQNLAKNGIVESHQGIKGGYKLLKNPKELTIMEIIKSFNEKISIVECLDDDMNNCNRKEDCNIKIPMVILQKKVESIFNHTFISDLIQKSYKTINLKLELN